MADSERIKQSKHESYLRNKEKVRANNIKYRKEHPEKSTHNPEYDKRYRKEHAALINTKSTEANSESQKHAVNSKQLWSEDEIKQLGEMKDKGMTYAQMGEVLGRSIKSVSNAVSKYLHNKG